MPFYELATGSTIEYPDGLVHPPDIVTERLAGLAALTLREIAKSKARLSTLELGIASGAFSRFVLDLAEVDMDLTGIDIAPAAVETARANLEGRPGLHSLHLIEGDWNSDATFKSGPFDCIYFNPPYLRRGSTLRPEFREAPNDTIFADDPMTQYESMLPRIVESLAIGGIAIVRYPGDGSATFAGEDSKQDHDPWINLEEAGRTMERIILRAAWFREVMPADTRSFMFRSHIAGRRINAEIFTRIGDHIANAPEPIRDIEAYWKAYE